MSDYIVFYMKIACTITQWLHDVLPIKLHVYYMMLHVPAFITWTLHVNLHVWLQIILHVILHPNYMVITYILHDISKKISLHQARIHPPRSPHSPGAPARALVPPSPPLCAPQGGWSGRGKGRGAAAAACFGRSVLTAKQAHKCTLRPECTLYWPFLESTCLAVNHHARVGAQGRWH